MIKYTHRKKSRYATCIVWQEDNTQVIIEILDRAGCEAHEYQGQLMLRWKDDWHKPSIEMMEKGKSVIRIGEDDSIKIITVDEMNSGYEEI